MPSPKLLLGMVAASTAAVFPFFSDPHTLTLGMLFLMYVALAESYDILGGFMGYMNLGHIVFFGIGAYSFGILANRGLPLPAAFLLGAFPAALVAALLAVPFFRLRGFYFAVATLGLVGIFQVLATNLAWLTGGYRGLRIEPGDHTLTAYYGFVVLAGATVLVAYRISRSRFGLAMRSIREDEDAASVFGINTFRYKFAALILSAFLAGVAGEIYLWFLTFLDPRGVFGLDLGLTPIVMALLGGTGTVIGPIIGAGIVVGLEEALLTRITYFHRFLFGVILVAVGIFMPTGIAGSRRLRTIVAGNFRRSSYVPPGWARGPSRTP